MIVFVNGATAGFGAAIARRFAAAGHRVVAADRRADRLDALVTELGPSLFPFVLDVTDRAATETVAARLPTDFAAVDLLVNAGLEPAHDADRDDWETMIETNVKGLTRMTRALLPGMVERGRGHIVNVGSVAAHFPYPGGNVYGATKAFVDQFSLNLRADLLGTPVRVTNVQPGPCGGTEISSVPFERDDEKVAKIHDRTQPLTAEDVAETVFWVSTLPPHVNINSVQMVPVCRTFGPLAIKRG